MDLKHRWLVGADIIRYGGGKGAAKTFLAVTMITGTLIVVGFFSPTVAFVLSLLALGLFPVLLVYMEFAVNDGIIDEENKWVRWQQVAAITDELEEKVRAGELSAVRACAEHERRVGSLYLHYWENSHPTRGYIDRYYDAYWDRVRSPSSI